MSPAGFTHRLIGAVLAATLFAAAATTALWSHGHQRRLEQAVAGHAEFVLAELKAALESRLNLGLSIGELPQADTLLEQARGALPGIQSIVVVDEEGTVVFATDVVEVGERAPDLPAGFGTAEPAVSGTADSDALWSVRTGGARTYGLSLTTSFGTSAGAVALRLPAGLLTERVNDFALVLGLQAFGVAVAVGALASLAALVLARRSRRAVERLAVALEELAAAPGAQPGGRDRPVAPLLGLPLPGFAATVRQRVRTLDEATREISRLDEMA